MNMVIVKFHSKSIYRGTYNLKVYDGKFLMLVKKIVINDINIKVTSFLSSKYDLPQIKI